MIIYMECTLNYLLFTNRMSREEVDMLVHSGEQKAVHGTAFRYVIKDGKYENLKEIIEKRPE